MAGWLAATTGPIVATLTAAGVRATDDPRNVNPPCVWVEPDTADRTARCRAAATARLTAMVPGPANGDALRALDQLAADTQTALDDAGMPWTQARLGVVAHPVTGDTLAALTITVPRTVEV